MTESQKLLAEYALNGSEAAFRELVARYVNLVYSTALRLVDGNTQLAEDVTQTVFINLASKASRLSSGVMVGGWLHQHTYHVASKAMRSERRRQAREREAVEMNSLQDPSEANWEQIAPILDEVITQLGREDRAAIVLRFFEQRNFRSIGEALGNTENGARMRVNRALEKLHSLLKTRGVTLSVGALGTLLTTQAVVAAPAGLVLTLSSVALAGAAAGAGTTLTFLNLMATTKLKLGVTALAIAGAATMLVIQERSRVSQRDENRTLRTQVAQLQATNEALSNRVAKAMTTRVPRLPAPAMPASVSPGTLPVEAWTITNLYAQLMAKNPTKLSAEQIRSYLEANRRSPASLLAGFRTTGDLALLEEAMREYPDHPQVAFEAALRKDALPTERRQWLDAFKKSAPDNALANYLSAADYFRAGLTDQAVQELVAASGKPQFQDYSLDRVQDDEDAYRTAGFPVAQAKMVATMQLLLPQLVEVKELGRQIVELGKLYRQAGDETSAQAALLMGVNLARRYGAASPGESLISQLVGIALERDVLRAMDPAGTFGDNGQTVQDRLDQLGQARAAVRDLNKQAEPLWQTMSDQDWISYHNRSTTFGEETALRWLVGKYGQK